MNEQPLSSSENGQLQCPSCEARRVTTRYEERSFPFQHGENSIQVSVVVPVRVCNNCGFTYEDAAAEDAEHDAVCRQLGVFTPSQIVQLRQKYELSRAEFARITRLGEATLSRWEKGALIQNGAYDQLLYLLQVPSNLELLRTRFSRRNGCTVTNKKPIFRRIERTKTVCADAEAFDLRASASYERRG